MQEFLIERLGKMYSGVVNKIIPFSSVDGPGNRTAIFLQECNFNCLYCHNPETINKCVECGDCINGCPVQALSLKDNHMLWDEESCIDCDKCIVDCKHDSTPKTKNMTSDDILKELLNVLPFISGITISGGECSLQADFITEIFKKTAKLDINNFLDSNGYILLKNLDLYQYMDKAMIDLKSFDMKEHLMLTGKDNVNVIQNIKDLARDNKLYEVRTVIVPNVLDNESNVSNISRLIASLDPYIRYKLIKYRPYGIRKDMIDSYSPGHELMKKLNDIATKNGCKNIVIV